MKEKQYWNEAFCERCHKPFVAERRPGHFTKPMYCSTKCRLANWRRFRMKYL